MILHSGEDDQIHSKNRFICEGVGIGKYLLLTGEWL